MPMLVLLYCIMALATFGVILLFWMKFPKWEFKPKYLIACCCVLVTTVAMLFGIIVYSCSIMYLSLFLIMVGILMPLWWVDDTGKMSFWK